VLTIDYNYNISNQLQKGNVHTSFKKRNVYISRQINVEKRHSRTEIILLKTSKTNTKSTKIRYQWSKRIRRLNLLKNKFIAAATIYSELH
jgi:hypothetical protein